MIEVSPQMPPMLDKPVAEAIVDCGVKAGSFTVTDEDDLEGNMIVFAKGSGASEANLQCIWDATWPEFVQFAEPDLQAGYEAIGQKYYDTHLKGQVIEYAHDNLAKHGLLETLPKISDFHSRDDFAAALERHCGFEPHSTLRVEGDRFTVWPQTGTAPPSVADQEKISCLFSSLTLAAETDGNLKIGFVGNERVAD